MKVTEILAEVDVQALVDYIIDTIICVQQEVLNQCTDGNENVYMIFKCGCDGNSGHSEYKLLHKKLNKVSFTVI